MLWTESLCYFFRVTVFEAALSSRCWSYLPSMKVFLPLLGTIFIYGQRFLMAVVILSPLYIITLLQFKNRFLFSRKTQITFQFSSAYHLRIFGNKGVAYTVEWTELFLLIPCQSGLSDFAVKSAKRVCSVSEILHCFLFLIALAQRLPTIRIWIKRRELQGLSRPETWAEANLSAIIFLAPKLLLLVWIRELKLGPGLIQFFLILSFPIIVCLRQKKIS